MKAKKRQNRKGLPPPATDEVDNLIDAVLTGRGGSVDPRSREREAGLDASTGVALNRRAAVLLARRVMLRWIGPPAAAFLVALAATIWSLREAPSTSPPIAGPTLIATARAPVVEPLPLYLVGSPVQSSRDAAGFKGTVGRDPRPSAIERPSMVSESVVLSTPSVRPTAAPLATRQPAQPVITRPLNAGAPAVPTPVETTAGQDSAAVAATLQARADMMSAAPVLATPVAAARPEIAEPSEPREAIDEQAVRISVNRYAGALQQMDVRAAAEVYPAVDQRALRRAFSTLASQGVVFKQCRVNVSEPNAIARCSGTVQFVPKFGAQTERVVHQVWQFDLHKQASGWKIEAVSASEVNPSNER